MLDAIVCFGDSLTQHGYDVSKRGWVAQLSLVYIRRLDVINRGFSGFTSRWVLPLVPQLITPFKPKLLIILLGSNDSLLPSNPRHVPIAEFKSNIEQMVASCLPGTRVVLITPPSLGEKLYARHQTDRSMERTFESVKACADAVRDVARDLSVPCVDLWKAVEERTKDIGGDLDGYDAFSYDGVHLNAGGNDLLFELLMQTIKSRFPELDPDSMPYLVPDHATVSASIAKGEDVSSVVLKNLQIQ
ncbi:isoamyl acetate-hydrolyzing esterase [Coemansia sp. RSA 2681]|nr:isoamyl acetate-hydrolyzing esterase [Coemansia sp. RSA 2681]